MMSQYVYTVYCYSSKLLGNDYKPHVLIFETETIFNLTISIFYFLYMQLKEQPCRNWPISKRRMNLAVLILSIRLHHSHTTDAKNQHASCSKIITQRISIVTPEICQSMSTRKILYLKYLHAGSNLDPSISRWIVVHGTVLQGLQRSWMIWVDHLQKISEKIVKVCFKIPKCHYASYLAEFSHSRTWWAFISQQTIPCIK